MKQKKKSRFITKYFTPLSLVFIGTACLITSSINESMQGVELSKAIGVIILLVSIKKIKGSSSINFHEKQS